MAAPRPPRRRGAGLHRGPVDLALDGLQPHVRLQPILGSITEPGLLECALALPVDTVLHLASVHEGAAEKKPLLARRVNLDATLRLVERLRAQGDVPRLIFASAIAACGGALPAEVDDDTLAKPALSDGAHELAVEILIADADRRGWLRACSLRLPGDVARHGEDWRGLVRYVPAPTVQWLFATPTPLRTVRADARGFAHDGSADALVQRGMQGASMS